MGKVTIQSIAKDLGLSRNTVSMALKGNDLVTPRTRERIMQYAEKAGYMVPRSENAVQATAEPAAKPDYQVMILRKPDVAIYWDKIINGISEEASLNHCRTQVAVVTQADEERLRLPPGLNEKLQAVFCVKLMNREYIRKIKQMGIAVFLFDDYVDTGNEMMGDTVKTLSFQPVMELTRHLLGQGMRKIGFLNDGSGLYESMHDRYMGYLYAMEGAGAEPVPQYVIPDVECDNFYSAENFARIVDGFDELPEAMVCGNDQIAVGLTRALRGRGIRVPEDVAVTGFDNDEEGALDPFFTTVNVDAKWLGRRMTQCFLWRMQNPDAPYEKIVVSGQVILRRSSCQRIKTE